MQQTENKSISKSKTTTAKAISKSDVSQAEVKHQANEPDNENNLLIYNPRERALVLDRVFKKYIEEKLLRSEPIPIEINHLGYHPNREQICIQLYERFGLHVDPGAYLYSGWFAEKIKELVQQQLEKAGKDKPTLKEKQAARAEELKRQQEYATILVKWLDDLKEQGRKLKFNNYSGGTDNAWIAEQTGIPYPHLVKTVTLCYRLVKKARKEIGLENFLTVEEFVLKQHTYQKLLDYGTDCRRSDFTDQAKAQSQINNTRYALLRFLKVKNLILETKIGAEFGILFQQAVDECAASIENAHTRKKFISEIKRWQKYYEGLLRTDNLPPDFADALKFLIEASGRTYNELEKLWSGKKRATGGLVASWAKSRRRPSYRYLPLVNKIEEFFNLPRNTLASRVAFDNRSGNSVALRNGNFPLLSRTQIALVAQYLPPNFPLLQLEEQQKLVKTICDNVIKRTNEYRRRHSKLMKEPYRLKAKNYSPELIREIEEFIEFKTAFIPPAGYKRGKKARWKEDPEQLGTINVFKGSLECLFGILTASKEEKGFEVPVDQLSLLLLVLPNTWRAFLSFMQKRYGELPVSTANRYLQVFHPLIHRKRGWITQSPHIVERLKPIPGFLSESEITAAKSDWRGFIQKIDQELTEIITAVEDAKEQSPHQRDSHLPILPILESDSPLGIMRRALEVYERQIPSQYTAPMTNAETLRNLVFLRMLAETALRRSNIVNITWSEDNTGHLRRGEEGRYFIVIPHNEFKNQYSSYFGPTGRKHPYEVVLSKAISPLLDEYLFRSRPYLIERRAYSKRGRNEGGDSGFLFISTPSGNKQRISYQAATDIVTNFSKSYLVYNPLTETGIKGVEPFGLHAVRHIVATHVLKKTHSFFDAAIAIQDSEQSARRHYARYLPAERDKRIRHLIIDLMEGEGE